MDITLSISVVTFKPDIALLTRTLLSLARAVSFATTKLDFSVALCLVDNGPGAGWQEKLAGILGRVEDGFSGGCRLLSGRGNLGYGAAHNLGAAEFPATYHLVLNPDVILDEDALYHAVTFLSAHSEVGLIAPSGRNLHNEPQFLCKTYPSVFILALRAFAPPLLKRTFSKKMERYELRTVCGERPYFDIPLVSGCFMFCRRSCWDLIGGFSRQYFMYFEDYDLSIRIGRVARKAYVPTVRIKHAGGAAAKKGAWHITLFIRSAITFFNRHGWRWV